MRKRLKAVLLAGVLTGLGGPAALASGGGVGAGSLPSETAPQ